MTELGEELDLEDVAAWCLRQKWFTTGPWDTDFHERKFYPQVITLYRESRARELEKEKRDEERREQNERMWAEAQVAREQAAHAAWLMKDMRKWGPENGFFVGTRGRIPRRVVDAYNKAKGI